MARVQTTPLTRAALWLLLVYVVVMLTLIGVKFVRAVIIPEGKKAAVTTTAPPLRAEGCQPAMATFA